MGLIIRLRNDERTLKTKLRSNVLKDHYQTTREYMLHTPSSSILEVV
jgi:hypothetical protein